MSPPHDDRYAAAAAAGATQQFRQVVRTNWRVVSSFRSRGEFALIYGINIIKRTISNICPVLFMYTLSQLISCCDCWWNI